MSRSLLRADVPVAELDPFNELRPSAFVRLLQLAASNATTELGYGVDWYARNQATWIVRHTHLDLLTTAHQGEVLEVTTWVSDFRRVRSLRQYEVNKTDGSEVARGFTDWVFVDTTTGTPATPPAELQEAFMPDGVSTAKRPARIRIPDGGETVALRAVELADLDSLGHVNNSRYVDIAQQALYGALAAQGWRQEWKQSAAHLRIASLDIEYMTAAVYGDPLVARVATTALDDSGVTTKIEINPATPAARLSIDWQWSGGTVPSQLAEALTRLAAGS